MEIQLTQDFREGGFAKVILSRQDGRAIKVFKRLNEYPPQRSRSAFLAEVDAYKILKTHANLQKHTPIFHGVVEISKITDCTGLEVSHQFMLDCCYVLSLCQGEDTKLKSPLSVEDYLLQFVAQLKAVGIAHTDDCSVFNRKNKDDFVLIDFATHDAADAFDMKSSLATTPKERFRTSL